MIHLVKHFLLRARPKIALLVSLGAVVWLVGSWRLLPSELESGQYMPVMMFAIYGMIVLIPVLEEQEFDLVLPVRRRKLYLAKTLAVLLLTVIVAVPVSAAALAVAVFRGHVGEALRFCACFTLCFMSTALMVAPLMRLVRKMPPLFAFPIVPVPLIVVFIVQVMAFLRMVSGILSAVVAVLATALVWFLGRSQFERYELAPSADAGPARIAVTQPGFIDQFSPMVRVLVRAVWLQWRLASLLVCVGIIGYVMKANDFAFVWFYPVFGNSIIVCLSRYCVDLLPFVSRRTILRSVMGPVMATQMLMAGVLAVTSASAQMIVWGLALALMTVGMIWLMLPSAREYRRPVLLKVRHNIWWFLWTCIAACTFMPGNHGFFLRPLSDSWPGVTPVVSGNPLLVSCIIILAIALFWWRCERKFRYFESGTSAQEEPSPWTWRTSSSN